MMKSRETIYPKSKTKNSSSFASNWEMYDTYEDLDQEEEEELSTSENSSESGFLDFQDTASVDSYRMSKDEKQYVKLSKNPKFLEAICVVERLLANNCYNKQQKIFRGLTVENDLRENIQYNYRLNHLWMFANENTKGMIKDIIR